MKKKLGTLLIAAGIGLASSGIMAQERVFFGIATGGTGGTYYPLGGMLAQVISNNSDLGDKKISATAETGNASVANATLLGRSSIESAFVAADVLDAAYNGKNQFDGKAIKNLRALGALYPETVQLVSQPGIKSFSDLKGKTVSSGSPGSGQWQLLGDLLTAYGMQRSDVKEDYSSLIIPIPGTIIDIIKHNDNPNILTDAINKLVPINEPTEIEQINPLIDIQFKNTVSQRYNLPAA